MQLFVQVFCFINFGRTFDISDLKKKTYKKKIIKYINSNVHVFMYMYYD